MNINLVNWENLMKTWFVVYRRPAGSIHMRFSKSNESDLVSDKTDVITYSLFDSCDEVAEWLRRWTANPMCSARVGSNPILVAPFWQSWIENVLIFSSIFSLHPVNLKFSLRTITDQRIAGKMVRTWAIVDQYNSIFHLKWFSLRWLPTVYNIFFSTSSLTNQNRHFNSGMNRL